MPQQLPQQQTIRFLELTGLLVLLFLDANSLTNSLQPWGEILGGLFLVSTGTVFVGWAFPAVRRISWVALQVSGLLALAWNPLEPSGVVLFVLAAYPLLHDRRLQSQRRLIWIGMVVALLGAQVAIVGLWSQNLLPLVFRFVILDGVVGWLCVVFRDDLFRSASAVLPRLEIGGRNLDERQLLVLKHHFAGESSKQIASRIGRSDAMVRKHLTSLYREFGVPGAKELFALGRSHHLDW